MFKQIKLRFAPSKSKPFIFKMLEYGEENIIEGVTFTEMENELSLPVHLSDYFNEVFFMHFKPKTEVITMDDTKFFLKVVGFTRLYEYRALYQANKHARNALIFAVLALLLSVVLQFIGDINLSHDSLSDFELILHNEIEELRMIIEKNINFGYLEIVQDGKGG